MYLFFHRVFFGTYSDVLCSEEYQTKKLLVCCKMFAFFKAIFKFFTAKKLFIKEIRYKFNEPCKLNGLMIFTDYNLYC